MTNIPYRNHVEQRAWRPSRGPAPTAFPRVPSPPPHHTPSPLLYCQACRRTPSAPSCACTLGATVPPSGRRGAGLFPRRRTPLVTGSIPRPQDKHSIYRRPAGTRRPARRAGACWEGRALFPILCSQFLTTARRYRVSPSPTAHPPPPHPVFPVCLLCRYKLLHPSCS
jgi:hypothetical protein